MAGKFGVIGDLDKWKSGDLPGNQMVYVVLNDHFTTNTGHITVTAKLASEGEVDFAIDQLIKDLEKIRKKAKEKIRTVNQRIKDSYKGT
jgi:uncharacterized protein YjbJ (UPF0337 family)